MNLYRIVKDKQTAPDYVLINCLKIRQTAPENTTTQTGFSHENFPMETKLCEISHGIPTNYSPNC